MFVKSPSCCISAIKPRPVRSQSVLWPWWWGQRWIENRRYFKAVSVEIATKQCRSFAGRLTPGRLYFPVINSLWIILTAEQYLFGPRESNLEGSEIRTSLPSICHNSEYLACMLPEHILSVKYLWGQLLLFSIIEKTAAVLLNPPLAPQGLVKPARASKFFFTATIWWQTFVARSSRDGPRLTKHQMSVALALNRLSPRFSASWIYFAAILEMANLIS